MLRTNERRVKGGRPCLDFCQGMDLRVYDGLLDWLLSLTETRDGSPRTTLAFADIPPCRNLRLTLVGIYPRWIGSEQVSVLDGSLRDIFPGLPECSKN